MTTDLFKDYDKKLIAYEWINDYPTGAYEFILELIAEVESLRETNQFLKDLANLSASLLEMKRRLK